MRNLRRALHRYTVLSPIQVECGLQPVVSGVRMDDYWDLVEGTSDEKKAKGWYCCLYPLVGDTMLYIPKNERVEFTFDRRHEYELNAGFIVREFANFPDERFYTDSGVSKLANWNFAGTPLTELVDCPSHFVTFEVGGVQWLCDAVIECPN